MEHLLQKGKCSIFHNIFKYVIFQRRQKSFLWSKALHSMELTIKDKKRNIMLARSLLLNWPNISKLKQGSVASQGGLNPTW